MTAKNPIEQRIDEISDQWVAFAEDDDARVLIWLAQPDEYSFVDAFISMQQDERAGTMPDLFLKFRADFAQSTSFVAAIGQELQVYATALLDGLREARAQENPEQAPAAIDGTELAGIGAWEFPARDVKLDDAGYFVKLAQDFSKHLQLPAQLAMVLQPPVPAHATAYTNFLGQVSLLAPPTIRLIVVDSVRQPSCPPLAQQLPTQVKVSTLDLDVATAQQQVSQQAGNLDTPGGRFRHLFLTFTQLLGQQELGRAKVLAGELLEIAGAQSWYGLMLPVHFAMGAALAGADKPDEATSEYQSAELAAIKGVKAEDETAPKLRVQARMVLGGHYVATQAFAKGAELFVATVEMAQAIEDKASVIDCYRLAAFCFEQLGQDHDAWQQGMAGLHYARSLAADEREATTLDYLGEGLLRVATRTNQDIVAKQIDAEMKELLGSETWRPEPAPPAADPG